jgi:hypothetical protein
VFAGTKHALARIKELQPKERPELAKAYASVGDAPIRVALLIDPDSRRAFEDTLPNLPKWLGGGPTKVLTQGVRWGALGIDLAPALALRVHVESPDEAAASKVKQWWSEELKLLARDKEVQTVWPKFQDHAEKLEAVQKGTQVAVALDETALVAFLEPALTRFRAASARARDTNHLRQIGLALHNSLDSTNTFPPAANYDKANKPLLSWRVHLLPYLDQVELYKQFKLDEPWDSEHNKKLIPKMPAVYRTSPKLEDGKTTLLGVCGDKAFFSGTKGNRIGQIQDGLSNTIAVVDVDEPRAVIWTKPEDYTYDNANPAAGLKGRFDGKFGALFGDASVRMISGTIDAKLLEALFTRNGGEVIGAIP